MLLGYRYLIPVKVHVDCEMAVSCERGTSGVNMIWKILCKTRCKHFLLGRLEMNINVDQTR